MSQYITAFIVKLKQIAVISLNRKYSDFKFYLLNAVKGWKIMPYSQLVTVRIVLVLKWNIAHSTWLPQLGWHWAPLKYTADPVMRMAANWDGYGTQMAATILSHQGVIIPSLTVTRLPLYNPEITVAFCHSFRSFFLPFFPPCPHYKE